MFTAATNNRINSLIFLHGIGCDYNSSNYDSQSVLHIASYNGHFKMCEFLINNGVKIDSLEKFFK